METAFNETARVSSAPKEEPQLNFEFFYNQPIVGLEVLESNQDREQAGFKLKVQHNESIYFLDVNFGKILDNDEVSRIESTNGVLNGVDGRTLHEIFGKPLPELIEHLSQKGRFGR